MRCVSLRCRAVRTTHSQRMRCRMRCVVLRCRTVPYGAAWHRTAPRGTASGANEPSEHCWNDDFAANARRNSTNDFIVFISYRPATPSAWMPIPCEVLCAVAAVTQVVDLIIWIIFVPRKPRCYCFALVAGYESLYDWMNLFRVGESTVICFYAVGRNARAVIFSRVALYRYNRA